MTKQLTIPSTIKTLKISTDKDLKNATEILSKANKHLDIITKEKEKLTKPLNQTLKEIRSRYKPVEEKLETIISEIRKEMTQYQTTLINQRNLEEQKIASRIGEGKGKLKLETAINKIESLQTVNKETITDSGSIQFREKKQLKVTDLTLIPDMYWMVNDALLLEDLKSGRTVPGAELETIQVPVNFR